MKGFTGYYEQGCFAPLQRSYGVYNEKFPADKVNYTDERYELMLDGVLLNATELCREFQKDAVCELLQYLWENDGTAMNRRLKGSFVLSLLDKQSGTLYVANDRLSRRPLYYYIDGNRLFFSSRFLELVTLMAEKGIYPAYNAVAFEMMAREGQLYDRFTYLEGVYWLRPYEYILCDENGIHLCGGEPVFSEDKRPERELLAEFDCRFREAVRLQCEKNREAGYRQMASASGGMDSRSAILMADKLGYTPELCFCYSQKGSADEIIAQQLTESVGAEFFFYPLDKAAFLWRPEEHGYRNECQVSFCGATGALTISEMLDLSQVGIVHTGSWGGEMMGDDYRSAQEHSPVNPFSGEAAAEFAVCMEEYASQEKLTLFKHLRGCQNFVRMFEDKAEALSPFMDEDVYEFVRTIPVAMRTGRRFYCRWMNRYLKNSLKVTHSKTRVNAPRLFQYAARGMDKILRKIKGQTGWSMTPVERWLEETPGLRAFLDEKATEFAAAPMPGEAREKLLRQCAIQNISALYALTGLLAAYFIQEAQGTVPESREIV